MIDVINAISNFKALDYLLEKENKGAGEVLLSNVMMPNFAKFLQDMEERFDKKYTNIAYHISHSLPSDESLSNEKWIAFAEAYIEKMQLSEHPYRVWSHTDKAHSHIHILVGLKSFMGDKIAERFYKKQSNTVTQEIVKAMGLTPLPARQERIKKSLGEHNLRTYYVHKALQKAFKNDAIKERLHEILDAADRDFLLQLQSNDEIKAWLGEDRYDALVALLDASKSFNVLYKDEIQKQLDEYMIQAKSLQEYLTLVNEDKTELYARILVSGQKEYIKYIVGNKEFKDSTLSARFRLANLRSHFEDKSATLRMPKYIATMPLKETLHKFFEANIKIFYTFEHLMQSLEPINIQAKFVQNETGIYGVQFVRGDEKVTGSDVSYKYSYKKMNEQIRDNNKSALTKTLRPLIFDGLRKSSTFEEFTQQSSLKTFNVNRNLNNELCASVNGYEFTFVELDLRTSGIEDKYFAKDVQSHTASQSQSTSTPSIPSASPNKFGTSKADESEEEKKKKKKRGGGLWL